MILPFWLSRIASVPQTCMPSPPMFSARRQTYSGLACDDYWLRVCTSECKSLDYSQILVKVGKLRRVGAALPNGAIIRTALDVIISMRVTNSLHGRNVGLGLWQAWRDGRIVGYSRARFIS